ncbi:MAG: hypothetical protein ACI8QC_004216 [Planctomycetota bacterium]|jgi:hypothetical protein
MGPMLVACLLLASPVQQDVDTSFFEEHVAPILERACLSCHDTATHEGKLDLSSAGTALSGGEQAVILPGRPADSLLLITVSEDPPEMPKQGAPLSQAEIDKLRRWIAGGAPWPEGRTLTASAPEPPSAEWWSLQPLVKPTVPETHSDWVRNEVDAFVLARLTAAALTPSPEADRRTLIRRLTYDLHGLPPTRSEVDAFLHDERPGAYERLTDRLLESARYGERWGRHWLDVVHYGETHGYDKDKLRTNAWPYRDYVIRALQEDKPYARFVAEQVAGDMLYPQEPDGIVATGLIAAGPWDFVGHVELREGTLDKEITRSLDRDDMLTTVMSTFTSTTVSCARCHDHKFDPVSQQDYYSLQAVFSGIERAERPYDSDPLVLRTRQRLTQQQQELAARERTLQARVAASASPRISALDQALDVNAGRLADAPAMLAPGAEPSPTIGYHSAISNEQDATKWVQIDLGEPRSPDQIVLLPAHVVFGGHPGPGFGFPPRFRVEVSNDVTFERCRVLLDHTLNDFPHPGDEPVVIQAAGVEARYVRITATKLWERTGDWIFALSELLVLDQAGNLAAGATTTALDTIENSSWARAHLTDSATSLHRLEHGPDLIRRVAAREERSALLRERALLAAQRYTAVEATLDTELRIERGSVAAHKLELVENFAALPAQGRVYAAASDFPAEGNFTPALNGPRPVYLLHRGDVRLPGAEASPGALACLPALAHHFDLPENASEGARRAALARWLTDPENPLTWRSIVNRVWHYHFGRGLADTPNDFGRMGALPTHPKLLDWLAVTFLEGGGSLKDLHRLLVTSAVYRQVSSGRPDSAHLDAGNRLLWRMNRRRLEAEAVRDSVLAVSGRLDLTMGGPPDQQFQYTDDHSPRYDYELFDAAAEASMRRSVYRCLVRSVQDPFFECLDAADPSLLTPRRNTTLTALQALALLNNPFMVGSARSMAENVAALHAEPAAQVAEIWRRLLARDPRPKETALLEEHVRVHGLASLCRLAFNLNEFLLVD